MKCFKALLMSALSSALWLQPIAAEASSDLSQRTYDQVLSIVDRDFYDQGFKGLPWQELRARYRSKIKGDESPEKTQLLINELLGFLKTSHTNYYLQNDQSYWALKSIFSHDVDGFPICQIGAWFEKIDGRWFVKNALTGSVAAKAGLISGDEIVSVNRRELAPVQSFADCSKRVEIEYRRTPGGNIARLSLRPNRESFQRTFLRATSRSSKLLKHEGAKIAYFHLWAGTHEKFLAALKDAIARHHTSDAFILDLRDGFGGAYFDYIKPFIAHDEEGNPIAQIYSKPLVVLVNEGTRSGKEYISYLLRKQNRATFVGTRTAGAVIAGKPYEIETAPRSLLFLAVLPPGEDGLEGRGFLPDHDIPNFLPYRNANDPQLDFALRLAKRLSQRL